jgi:hypothetical protein
MIAEIGKSNEICLNIRGDLDAHLEKYSSFFMNDQFDKDKIDSWQKQMMKKHEMSQTFFEGKFENIHFEISRKVRIDDMK